MQLELVEKACDVTADWQKEADEADQGNVDSRKDHVAILAFDQTLSLFIIGHGN